MTQQHMTEGTNQFSQEKEPLTGKRSLLSDEESQEWMMTFFKDSQGLTHD